MNPWGLASAASLIATAGLAPFIVAPAVSALVRGSDAIVAGVTDGVLGPVARLGPAYPAAAALYEAWFVFTVVVLVRTYLRSGSPEVRRRSRGVVAVLAGAAVLASATEVFFPLVAPSAGNLGLASVYMLAVAVGAGISAVPFHFPEVPARPER